MTNSFGHRTREQSNSLDLDGMIQNLEGERQRIDEALEVLRRLHRVRKPGPVAAPAADPEDIQKQPKEKTVAGLEEK